MDEANAINHWKIYSEELNKLRLHDCLTDFSICVGEEVIKTHKVVLAANSDFFKAMFNNNSSEHRDGLVTIKEVEFEAVQVVVEFWYTGYMKISAENICQLLLATSRFQAKTASEVCSKFAAANLTPANCLNIVLLCDRCNLAELGEKAFVYCLENFGNIHQSSDLLSIDQEFFEKIISDDRLTVKNEIDVFEAIVNWVLFDETRHGQLDELMYEVRFLSIDPESMIKSIVTKSDSISEQWRVKAISILALSQNKSALCEQYIGKFNMKPRRPVSAGNQRLYVFGGSEVIDDITDCEVYDPSTGAWSYLPAVEKPVRQDLVITRPEWDFIYAPSIDGRNFQYYNLNTNSWLSGYRQVFDRPQSSHLIAMGEYIYSFDESPANGGVSSLFKYDMKGALITCKPLKPPRMDFGIAVHDHFIYVMGGSIGSETTNSVQRYDTQKNSWKTMANMKYKRHSFGSCFYDGKIYVAGGTYSESGTEHGSIKKSEVYDTKLNIWTDIANMINSRELFRLVEFLGQIYAIGGFSGRLVDALSQVEAYDPESNQWIKKNPMLRKRHSAAALVTRKSG